LSRSFSSCNGLIKRFQLLQGGPAAGMIGNDLFSAWSVRLAFGWSKLERSLGLIPFLSLQRAYNREHKSIRYWLWYQGPIVYALMGCHLFVLLYSGVTILESVSSFVLQAFICDLVDVLLAGGLPESSRYCRSSGPG